MGGGGCGGGGSSVEAFPGSTATLPAWLSVLLLAPEAAANKAPLRLDVLYGAQPWRSWRPAGPVAITAL